METAPPPETTRGTLLDGKVAYTQPRHGYRTGIEPVLLAAAVPARPGDTVLEAGTGAGAALLCLATRVPAMSGVGVERDPSMAALAMHNIAANGLTDRLTVTTADIQTFSTTTLFDHACANPPWHDPDGSASSNPGRDAAKRARPGLLAGWAAALASALRPRGTLTLILPASSLAEGMAALQHAGCGSPALLPLWPRAETPARLILLQAVRGGNGPARVLAGLTLHTAGQEYTEAAQAVLRRGNQISFT
jgi:tRNA1Val (adenine37-N6)-methyltransferase